MIRSSGAAFHQNTTVPFYALRTDFTFIGALNEFSPMTPTTIANNRWGGLLVGNFCRNAVYDVPEHQVCLCTTQNDFSYTNFSQITVSAVSFVRNLYHSSFEYHSCQGDRQPTTNIRFTASRCEGGE